VLLVINTEHAALSVKSTTLEGEGGVFISRAVPQEAESGFHGLTGFLDYCDRDDDLVPEREGILFIMSEKFL